MFKVRASSLYLIYLKVSREDGHKNRKAYYYIQTGALLEVTEEHENA